MAGLTHVLETVIAVFQRVLGRDDVAAGDNFFDSADQMAAVKVLRLLEDAFGVRIDLTAFGDSPTAAGVAALVERSGDMATTGGPPDVPVAFSQEGMLWQEHFVPGSQNLPPLVRRFRGPLAVEVLEAALDEIVRRHEPLRTHFEQRGGRPVQVVESHRHLALPVRDLADLSPGDQDVALADALAHSGRPFDLAVGPLFEAALFRFGPDDHVVVFRVHHSVYDDWSVSVFRHELSVLYAALLAGKPSPLADLPTGFAEFSRAQHRRLAGAAGTAQLSWWRRRLSGASFCLQLPIDDPVHAEGSPQASARPVSVTLARPLRDAIWALARSRRATPFMTMLAAFETLVQRYTGQADLLMASVVANRNRPELESMIGCFTKKILLRQDMSGDPSFTEVLSRTRESVLGALPNQDLAFETVLQETVGPAAAEHGLVPYVGVMFQGVTPQLDEVVFPGVVTSGYDTSATTTRAHFSAGASEAEVPAQPWGQGLYLGTFLILSLVETADGVSLTARGAFDGPATERLLANFVALLGEIVANPTRPVSELGMLDDDQRGELERWNDTDDGVAVDGCVHEVIGAQAARTPARVAVRTGSEDITFAELDARVDHLATRLAGAGVQRGSLVGVCLERSEHCVVAVLAIWKAGAAYVAIDPGDDADHLQFVIDDASLTMVVARSGLRPPGPPSAVRFVDVDAPESTPADVGTAPGVLPPGPRPVAMVFYGSGASRVERGVIVEHGSVVNLLTGLRGNVWPSEHDLVTYLSAKPTDDAFVRQLVSLAAGHTLRVVDPAAGPDRLVSLLADAEIDMVDVGPEEFRALVAAGFQKALDARDPPAVEPTLVVGSRAAVDDRTWSALGSLRGVRGHVLFGPPECGFGATVDPTPGKGQRVTIGRPMANVTAHVLHHSGAPLPVQVTGVLHVGGKGLARAGSGLYDTAQRARFLPDGRVEVVGAVADSVELRGFTIDRARVETVLRQSPGVADVQVVVRDDDRGSPRLVAHVVAEGDEAPGPGPLRVFLWSQLPGYAWPAEVVGAGGDDSSGGAEKAILASLWAGVVGADTVDPHENYWQAFSFLDALARAAGTGLQIADEQVTRNRTIATLAADLAAERLARSSAIAPGSRAEQEPA